MFTLFFRTLFLQPNSHWKPPGRCPISASHFRNKLPATASGNSHCGNFRSSAPQPPATRQSLAVHVRMHAPSCALSLVPPPSSCVPTCLGVHVQSACVHSCTTAHLPRASPVTVYASTLCLEAFLCSHSFQTEWLTLDSAIQAKCFQRCKASSGSYLAASLPSFCLHCDRTFTGRHWAASLPAPAPSCEGATSSGDAVASVASLSRDKAESQLEAAESKGERRCLHTRHPQAPVGVLCPWDSLGKTSNNVTNLCTSSGALRWRLEQTDATGSVLSPPHHSQDTCLAQRTWSPHQSPRHPLVVSERYKHLRGAPLSETPEQDEATVLLAHSQCTWPTLVRCENTI